MIEYIIEGIPNYFFQSQARMHQFENTNKLFKTFRDLRLPKSEYNNNQNQRYQDGRFTTNKPIRCFKWNSVGHMANECRKQEMKRCNVCGEAGHYAETCSKRLSSQELRYFNFIFLVKFQI